MALIGITFQDLLLSLFPLISAPSWFDDRFFTAVPCDEYKLDCEVWIMRVYFSVIYFSDLAGLGDI